MSTSQPRGPNHREKHLQTKPHSVLQAPHWPTYHAVVQLFSTSSFQALKTFPCITSEDLNSVSFSPLYYHSGGLVGTSCPTLVTPWTVAHQAPLSMGFPQQEYWNGLPLPSPRDFPDQKSNPGLLHCRLILYWLSYEFSNKGFLDCLTFLSAIFDTLHFSIFSQKNTLFSAWALIAHTRSIHLDTLLTVLAAPTPWKSTPPHLPQARIPSTRSLPSHYAGSDPPHRVCTPTPPGQPPS